MIVVRQGSHDVHHLRDDSTTVETGFMNINRDLDAGKNSSGEDLLML